MAALLSKWWKIEGWRIPTAPAISRVDVAKYPCWVNRMDASRKMRSRVEDAWAAGLENSVMLTPETYARLAVNLLAGGSCAYRLGLNDRGHGPERLTTSNGIDPSIRTTRPVNAPWRTKALCARAVNATA